MLFGSVIVVWCDVVVVAVVCVCVCVCMCVWCCCRTFFFQTSDKSLSRKFAPSFIFSQSLLQFVANLWSHSSELGKVERASKQAAPQFNILLVLAIIAPVWWRTQARHQGIHGTSLQIECLPCVTLTLSCYGGNLKTQEAAAIAQCAWTGFLFAFWWRKDVKKFSSLLDF